eukprot:gene19186-biopygen11518
MPPPPASHSHRIRRRPVHMPRLQAREVGVVEQIGPCFLDLLYWHQDLWCHNDCFLCPDGSGELRISPWN